MPHTLGSPTLGLGWPAVQGEGRAQDTGQVDGSSAAWGRQRSRWKHSAGAPRLSYGPVLNHYVKLTHEGSHLTDEVGKAEEASPSENLNDRFTSLDQWHNKLTQSN